MSFAISCQLQKVFSVTEIQEQEEISQARSPQKTFLFFYIMVLPWLLVLVAWLMEYFEIQINYLAELLPATRIIAIGLSIFIIAYPWFMRKRWLEKYSSNNASPAWMVLSFGMVLSVVPSIYGFALCLMMEAPLLELCLFALGSSIAALVWLIYNSMPNEGKFV